MTRAFRILCLGGSLTQRQWPRFLAEELDGRIRGTRFDVVDKGEAGATVGDVLGRIEWHLKTLAPDLVVMMSGSNNGPQLWKNPLEHRDAIVEAPAAFLRMGEAEPSPSPDAIRRGNACRENNDYEKAEREYEAAIQADPRNARGHVELGRLHRAKGDFEKAETAFQAAINADPQRALGHLELGNLYREYGDHDKAERAYQAGIQAEPRHGRGYVDLGKLHRNAYDHDKAERAFDAATRAETQVGRAYVEWGRLHRERNEDAKAERAFERSIEAEPQDPQGYLSLAKSCIEKGDHQKAAATFEAGIKADPRKGWGHVALGDLHLARGDREKARRAYEAGIKAEDSKPSRYIALGNLYREQGEHEKAERTYEAGIRLGYLNIVNDRFAGALWLLHSQRGRPDLAEPYDRPSYLPLGACRHYRKLREIVSRNGARLACMQHPMRSVEPLKEVLGKESGVLFVENRKNFREALERRRFSELFVDAFAGNYGHTTELGNRLIAQNLAAAVAQGALGKESRAGRAGKMKL